MSSSSLITDDMLAAAFSATFAQASRSFSKSYLQLPHPLVEDGIFLLEVGGHVVGAANRASFVLAVAVANNVVLVLAPVRIRFHPAFLSSSGCTSTSSNVFN